MKVIDLTHRISEKIPVYPGTEPPQLRVVSTQETDGYRETALSFYSHTGTHMDASFHIYADGTPLDALPLEQFVGKALVIDCTKAGAGEEIGMEYIEPVRELADAAEFLLFHSGWDTNWGKAEYFGAYPVLSLEVCRYLLESEKKGVGLDVIGIDPLEEENLTRHKLLLAEGNFVIIENLTHLGEIGNGLFTFAALPLYYLDADGAPVRAAAMLEV